MAALSDRVAREAVAAYRRATTKGRADMVNAARECIAKQPSLDNQMARAVLRADALYRATSTWKE